MSVATTCHNSLCPYPDIVVISSTKYIIYPQKTHKRISFIYVQMYITASPFTFQIFECPVVCY